MMTELPLSMYFLFGMTTLATIFLFCKATHFSKLAFKVIVLWLSTQSIIGLASFYENTNSIPPRFILLIAPPLLLTIWLFISKKGKKFVGSFNITQLTYLHVVRLPVELILFWLFVKEKIPQLMTFEGGNLDIIMGITAPVVAYFGIKKEVFSKKTILAWNFFGLILLANIVVRAILSIPTPFQKLAFSQPNMAVLYFPFILLPACIVPIVLFSHLTTIKTLLKGR